MNSDRMLLSVEEAGEVIGVGRSTMYELLRAGEVDSVRNGRCRRVPYSALVAYVERLLEEASGYEVIYRAREQERRRAGEGSVTWDESVQRWIGRLPRDEQGRRPKVSGRTKREAERKLERKLAEAEQGIIGAGRMTVGQFLEQWVRDTLMPSDRAKATKDKHEIAVRVHLVPGLGRVKLAKLTPMRVVVLAQATGLRQSELLGVRWSDLYLGTCACCGSGCSTAAMACCARPRPAQACACCRYRSTPSPRCGSIAAGSSRSAPRRWSGMTAGTW